MPEIYMEIEAVIFDFGGVLLRTEDRAPRATLAQELGMTYERIEQLVYYSPSGKKAALGLISADDHWEEVGRYLNLSPGKLKEFRRRFFDGDRLDEELLNCIRSLQNSYQTALLSNAWGDLRGYLENSWRIADAFDEIVISAEVGLAKPDARIYTLLLKRLDVEPRGALFVDDSIENVEAANQIGMPTIHFDRPDKVLPELQRLLKATQ
jgi:putative hydrolase of the HAD superfamily